MTFAGICIDSTEDGALLHHTRHAERLEPIESHATFSVFKRKTMALAWLSHSRPDASCAIYILTQVT